MSIFKSKQPQVKMPEPLPPPPERTDAETDVLAGEQRNRFARTGRASTMLTGGQGASGVMTASRYLGSAART